MAWQYPIKVARCARLPAADKEFVQIIDAAFADAAQRSGEWLLCRPGCTQCCIGVFEINALDALRLKGGLAQLRRTDPERAERVRDRALESVKQLSRQFPGDPKSGVLGEDETSRAVFEEFGDDEPCPALDPRTGRCDLYEYRPMTCRVFGPPIRSEGGLGTCELCFEGASPEEIAACEMIVDPDGLEDELLREVNDPGKTIVAFCLK
ncbi:MAG TPA: YkgJ family cysteine cluster protein [Terriglobales bacterium]|nr:YkgJ family cysteine cluster protein [Terriglobales bacterium]